jgi:hypothetical protein
MWFARFRRGTLCIETNGMQRFFAPTLTEHIYLFWLFRHFRRLPLNVLSERDRAWLERVCSRPGVPPDPDFVVGVIECDLPAPKKAPHTAPLFRPETATELKRGAR